MVEADICAASGLCFEHQPGNPVAMTRSAHFEHLDLIQEVRIHRQRFILVKRHNIMDHGEMDGRLRRFLA
jgi:hypothetical protein